MPDKDKYGHYVYKGICNECGYEKESTYDGFKRRPTLQCIHIRKLTSEQLEIWYEQNKKQCLHCGKDIPIDIRYGFNTYKERKFCSESCAASYNNRGQNRYKNALQKQKQIKSKKKIKTSKDKIPRLKKVSYCINCGSEISYGRKYCSKQCEKDYNYNQYIQRWKNGLEDGMSGEISLRRYIKRYIREKFNNKCAECGWCKVNPHTGNVPLEVHHIDGDYTNNKEDNLTLLCPNCHALTSTYRASNTGNGRDRKKYYK